MDKFFCEYQKYISTSEKLDFLYESLNKPGNDKNMTAIISFLIALENNNISIGDFSSGKDTDNFFSEFVNDERSLWRIFSKGLAYLKLGKFNLEICNVSKELFESFYKESGLEEKPSYYLFYLGHAFYEMGCMDTCKDNAKEYLQRSLSCFIEILDKYDGMGNSYNAMIYNKMGDIHMKLESLTDSEKTYAESEKFYKQSIALYEDFAFPYNGLGNIYRERGDYHSAICNYVLVLDKDPQLMYPWNYLGDCFRILEKYDIAYQCYMKAYELAEGSRIIYPLYGMGRIYYELGNRKNNNEKYYRKAGELFERIIDIVGSYTYKIRFALKDLAQVYEKLDRYRDAIMLYDNMLESNVFSKQENYIELIKERKKHCEDKIELRAICKSLSHENDKDPLHYVMCSISDKGLEKKINDKKESFSVNFLRREKMSVKSYHQVMEECKQNDTLSEFIKKSRSNKNDCYLQVLRRWNSYTPVINNGKGGGYYLKVDDIGIVIDPGFNFIKNFKDAKHSFSDIDIILITHSHDDHTSDLESILSLQNRYNNQLRDKIIPRELAKERRISTDEFLSQPLKDVVDSRYLESKRTLMLYTSKCVERKYCGIFSNKVLKVSDTNYTDVISSDKSSKHDIFLKVVKPKDGPIIINERISFYAIKANHKDLISNQRCLGYVINVDNNVIVFTGDTGWFNRYGTCLREQYRYIRKSSPNKNIILIAHLGGFHENENHYWTHNHFEAINADMCYPNHLGRVGMVELVKALKPNLCVISEFGEEFNGTRMQIADIFQEAFDKCGYKTKFLPADIGLQVDFPKIDEVKHEVNLPTIKAISRIDFKNRSIVYENVRLDDVEVGRFCDTNTLFFYKKESDLDRIKVTKGKVNETNKNNKDASERGKDSKGVNESDCIQAFLDGYVDDQEIDSTILNLSF